MEKASMILLHDYRTGKLGRISLETPQTRLKMVSNESEAPAPSGSSLLRLRGG
jgi:ribosome biogenesis GTPase A